MDKLEMTQEQRSNIIHLMVIDGYKESEITDELILAFSVRKYIEILTIFRPVLLYIADSLQPVIESLLSFHNELNKDDRKPVKMTQSIRSQVEDEIVRSITNANNQLLNLPNISRINE